MNHTYSKLTLGFVQSTEDSRFYLLKIAHTPAILKYQFWKEGKNRYKIPALSICTDMAIVLSTEDSRYNSNEHQKTVKQKNKKQKENKTKEQKSCM